MTLSEDMLFLSTYFKTTYDTASTGTLVGEELKRVENVAVPGTTETHIMDFATLCKGKLVVGVACKRSITGTVYIKKGEETVASGNLKMESIKQVPVTVEKGATYSIYISQTSAFNTVATDVTVKGNYVPNGYAIGLVR